MLGDTLDEDNETFSVNLTNIVGAASVASSTGTGTILDEDPAPEHLDQRYLGRGRGLGQRQRRVHRLALASQRQD